MHFALVSLAKLRLTKIELQNVVKGVFTRNVLSPTSHWHPGAAAAAGPALNPGSGQWAIIAIFAPAAPSPDCSDPRGFHHSSSTGCVPCPQPLQSDSFSCEVQQSSIMNHQLIPCKLLSGHLYPQRLQTLLITVPNPIASAFFLFFYPKFIATAYKIQCQLHSWLQGVTWTSH